MEVSVHTKITPSIIGNYLLTKKKLFLQNNLQVIGRYISLMYCIVYKFTNLYNKKTIPT